MQVFRFEGKSNIGYLNNNLAKFFLLINAKECWLISIIKF